MLAAYGAGVDSTAMLIEMLARGERVDHALFADTGAEKPETYAFLEVFRTWLAQHGVPLTTVVYRATTFKNFPPYQGLAEGCLTNGTLPSIAFGFGSCSQKFKIAPQNAWAENWAPARAVWAAGGKVVKLIGYDCSPADLKRYAHREGYSDPRYHYRYPLREWGWKRTDCEAAHIREAGLPVPAKSACFMCTATKPDELHSFTKAHLRMVVLMEARAAPRLRTVEGLWRKSVKGTRTGKPRPGRMTDYIRSEGLLDAAEIDRIAALAPTELTRWQAAVGEVPLAERPRIAQWLAIFQVGGDFTAPGRDPLFQTAAALLAQGS